MGDQLSVQGLTMRLLCRDRSACWLEATDPLARTNVLVTERKAGLRGQVYLSRVVHGSVARGAVGPNRAIGQAFTVESKIGTARLTSCTFSSRRRAGPFTLASQRIRSVGLSTETRPRRHLRRGTGRSDSSLRRRFRRRDSPRNRHLPTRAVRHKRSTPALDPTGRRRLCE